MGLLAALHLPPIPSARARSADSGGDKVAARRSAAGSPEVSAGVPVSNAAGGADAGGSAVLLPGIDPEIQTSAVKLIRKQANAPKLAFEPSLQILTPHPVFPFPTVLATGEEKTFDLHVANWNDEAPDTATLAWAASASSDKLLDVRIEGDAGGRGYLTVKGRPSVGPAVVNWEVIVDYSDRKTRFPGTAFAFMVGAGSAGSELAEGRMADGGGRVSPAQLDQDITNLLLTWQTAALAGVSEFVTEELEKKIDDLSAGDWTVWATALLGNIAWAATVFNFGGGKVVRLLETLGREVSRGRTQQWISFTISMAGIGVPAAFSKPSSGSGTPTVGDTHKMMDSYILGTFQNAKKLLGPQLRDIAVAADATRFEAAGKVAQVLFKPGCVQIDEKFQTVPTINGSFVAERHRKWASILFEKSVKEGKLTVLERAFREDDRKNIKANKPVQKM